MYTHNYYIYVYTYLYRYIKFSSILCMCVCDIESGHRIGINFLANNLSVSFSIFYVNTF